MSESATKIVPENDDLTYGDIIWGQFLKNRIAIVALYGLIILVLIAVFCPIIASDRPFIWTENGETSYPWITSLFDRNYYENSVDIFFNLLLVVSLPTVLVWQIVVRTLRAKNLEKRKYRRVVNRINLGIFFGFILLFLGISTQKYEEPYKQYLEEYTQAQEDPEPSSVRLSRF
jgi:hypothetical protein